MKITDGREEREYRQAAREAQARFRVLCDALWGEALREEISWSEAAERVTAARAALEREMKTQAEPLALDALGGDAA